MTLGVQYVNEICTIDGTSFIPGILEGDDCQLNYQTTLTKPNQEKPGEHSWIIWRRILKILTSAPKTTTNRLQQRLGNWINTHSKCGQWLSYQDKNGKFYARESHEDTEWKIYERTNRGTQLKCIDTTEEYQPIKHSTPVQIHISAGGKIYKELGAELQIDKKIPEDPAESFEQLLVDQPAWISDPIEFVTFAPDEQKYDKMATTINDVLTVHNKDGYLIAVSDGSVKHMHQMSFRWVLSTVGGLHLAKSYGGCDGRGSLLRAEAVKMLYILLFIVLMAKHRKRTGIKIIYVSDNLELINRNKEHLNYINPYPNNTLSAEFDITK